MDRCACFPRNEVLCQKIQRKINQPSAQQFDMGKPWIIQTGQTKFPIIIDRFLKQGGPPDGSSGIFSWAYSGKERPYGAAIPRLIA